MYTQTQEVLVKEVMTMTGAATEEEAVTIALEEYVKPKNPKVHVYQKVKGDLKGLLKYRGSGIWEGDLDAMREC